MPKKGLFSGSTDIPSKVLVIYIHISNLIHCHLPETTKASFGPQVTKPQVIFCVFCFSKFYQSLKIIMYSISAVNNCLILHLYTDLL